MKQEPDIKAVTQEASVLVAKATELFLEFLTSRAAAKRGSNEPLGYVDLGAPLARLASPAARSSACRSTRGAACAPAYRGGSPHALSLTLRRRMQPTPSLRTSASTSWPTSCRARCPAAWRRSRAQAQLTDSFAVAVAHLCLPCCPRRTPAGCVLDHGGCGAVALRRARGVRRLQLSMLCEHASKALLRDGLRLLAQ